MFKYSSQTWWLSNSSHKSFSAPYALIVVKPWSDAFKWVNTGLLAKH